MKICLDLSHLQEASTELFRLHTNCLSFHNQMSLSSWDLNNMDSTKNVQYCELYEQRKTAINQRCSVLKVLPISIYVHVDSYLYGIYL